jgi:maltooligosyltrehalose trehalohydrolase
LNLGPQPLRVEAQHVGPVEPQRVFSHRWPDDTPADSWPPFAARWTLGAEITL